VQHLLQLTRLYQELISQGEDPESAEDLFLLRRMDGGLFTLQTIDVLLAWVIMEDDGVSSLFGGVEFLS
jgi:hypothetical protein